MLPSVKEVGKIYKKWEKHSIPTKTFELRPFEKPDMSPHLIHMTHQESLFSILKSKSLIATIPSQSMTDWYSEKVVCFTESPTFAIDFFRYKSYKRWCDDLRFGIGFSKLKLAKKGVRPALYVERTELIKHIAEIQKLISSNSETNNAQGDPNNCIDQLRNQLKGIHYALAPYITPLDYNSSQQGFLWEREWRFAREDFIFELEDIQIICCPKNEILKIKEIVGEDGSHIKYIETWGEYDEVSQYLLDFQKNKIIEDKIDKLQLDEIYSYEEQISQEVSKLKLYENQLEKMSEKIQKVKNTIELLETRQTELLAKIEEEKEKACVYCGYNFNEVGGIAVRNWNDDGHFCSMCNNEMNDKIMAED